MKFVDSTEISIKSGKGGRGLVSFRTGHNAPKQGADGGDGGFGGNVYAIADPGINTLSCIRYRQNYFAKDGDPGGPNGRTGKNGDDLVLKLPLGTVIYSKSDLDTPIVEILEQDKKYLILKGGKRGLGNIRFLRANHQAPEEYTPGGEGEELDITLELKLIADVGFAGFPNAGKSTLLNAISAARPKVADYPFTTLIPHLGVVEVDSEDISSTKSFVAADIPGLIVGASQGRGLGHSFLKHIERTSLVAYVVDGFSDPENPPERQYKLLRKELSEYNPELGKRSSFVIISKADLAFEPSEIRKATEYFELNNIPCQVISAVSQLNLTKLKRKLFKKISKAPVKKLIESDTTSHLPSLSDFKIMNPQTFPTSASSHVPL